MYCDLWKCGNYSSEETIQQYCYSSAETIRGNTVFNELISSVLYNLTAMIRLRGRKLCTHLMTAFHFYSFLGILSPKAHCQRVKILSDFAK